MNIRTFWTLLIKVIGLWLLLRSLFVLVQYGSTTYSIFKIGLGVTTAITGWLVIGSLALFVFFLIIKYCLFNTAWLIEKLRLEKGFTEERLEHNIPYSSILKIAVIVIGGLLFIDSLPELCRQTFVYVTMKVQFQGSNTDGNPGWLTFYLVKTLIGYLLMVNSQWVVNLIERGKEE